MNTHLLLVTLTTGLIFSAVYGVGACTKSARSAGVADASQYACPTHPEEVRNASGNCPKCGMASVSKTPSNEPGK